jgi:membrane associated rhomboid family serine protease
MKLKNSLTTVLIFIIVAFYIVAQYAQKITWGGLPLQDQLFLVGKLPLNNGSYIGVFAGQWWRIFTVALTHANWLHLGVNMLAFFQLGNSVEHYYGRARYLVLLFVSLVTSSLIAIWLLPASQVCVGASGMIYGLFGVMLVTGKRMGVDYRELLGWIILNLIITFAIPGIAWQAHIGGLVGGVVIALVLQAIPRKPSLQRWE